MASNSGRESAKIYQFPTKSPLSAASRRSKTKSGVELSSATIPSASFGSGWYHEAAIQEADRNPKF